MSVLSRAISDGRIFGVSSYKRLIAAETSVKVRNIGRVHFRGDNSDFETLRQVFAYREYDTSEIRELEARLSGRYQASLACGRKPIIVDAGANIGAASLWFLSKYPDASIVAIEPDSNNLAILRKNTVSPQIAVVDGAVGSSAGFARTCDHGAGWATRTERAAEGKEIITMDEAFRRSGGNDPFLVKVDIEGFEADLFAKNLDWLGRVSALIIEPHDWLMPGKLTSRTFQRAVAQHDFEIFIRGENLIYARV